MSTATIADPAHHAQLAAIEQSGWGHTFRFVQPRNPAFWLFSWMIVLGAVETFRNLNNGFENVGSATTFMIVLFAVYTLPWVYFLRHVDRWSKIPGKLVLAGFLWGGLTATFMIAIKVNTAMFSIWGKLFGGNWVQHWGPSASAPWSEEIAKGMGVLLLLAIGRNHIRSAFDGAILGAFVGVGFQVFEDVIYGINGAFSAFGQDEVAHSLQISVMRIAVGFLSHGFYSALVGAGLVFILGTSTLKPQRGRGVLLVLASMALHGLWDCMAALSIAIGMNGLLMMLLAVGIEAVVAVTVFKRLAVGERSWMRDLMAPEVTRGTITDDELTALSGSRKARKAYIKAAKGHKNHAAAKNVIEAATDLAEQIAIARGAETEDVVFARSEVARVRTV
jgi:RsiW-degrading membrane proteinase PrsW (M82 family)